MSNPTPMILCGKMPSHIEGLSKALLPNGYDIIHVCSSLPAALTELPALLADGPTPTPTSGHGSNATTHKDHPISGNAVKGVIIGGGYSPDDFEQIKAACDKVKPMPFFRADVTKKRDGGKVEGPPPVEELSRRVMEALGGGEGEWVAGVVLF